ncbi:MAG: peptidase U32 family protein [Prolixibacteraceae bacterium]
MKQKIELLAPGGDVDSIKAAIVAGANAVYCGLERFNARNRASNITFENLQGILRLAHQQHCEVFLTLNIIFVDSEFPALIEVLNKLNNSGIDGIILQDLGLFHLLSTYFPRLKIHASTQLTTHNAGQIQFLHQLNASRVNLSRELNLNEIAALTALAHQHKVLTEVFVHGSLCLSFSGQCYMSSVNNGNSGNRGRCSQPCRDQYHTTRAGKDFPMNLKDNSAFLDILELAATGVDSFKIEGRIKQFHYVYSVVESWRQQLDRYYANRPIQSSNHELFNVFNRNFTNDYLHGTQGKNMFIDDPRDHSAIYLANLNDGATEEKLEQAKKTVYDDRTVIIQKVRDKIAPLNIDKVSLNLTASGTKDASLQLTIQSPDFEWVVYSDQNLAGNGTEALSVDGLLKRLKAINETSYSIKNLSVDEALNKLYLPFRSLTALKNEVILRLNNFRETLAPVFVPALKKHSWQAIKPTLSILISDKEDLHRYQKTDVAIYFQLPNSIKNQLADWITFFELNQRLIPWFPSVIIGADYQAALDFLQALQPRKIVTNNTGIAFEAFQRGIEWIAGPYMNTSNSFALITLLEKFNCSGAFLSNELSEVQLKSIKRPDNFQLYYSIYHPIVLMTSRQCLFHQVTGCDKTISNHDCLQHCQKEASITNLKKESFLLEKSKGNYHCLYNANNYLNTSVVKDIPHLFSGCLVDLRKINTHSTVSVNNVELIHLFENLLNNHPGAAGVLQNVIQETTCNQYQTGI